jgi:biotin transport system permease protein/energy-coupling factor transport system permease protein
MGELTTIGFKPGQSFLHQLDPRTKQILLIGFSIVSLQGTITFLTLTTTLVLFLFTTVHLSIRRLIFEIRYFLFLLFAVFVVRTVAFPHGWIPTVFTEGTVADALMVCWRLLLVVIMGLLLMCTTRIADIRAALIWFFKPLPLLSEKSAATMVGLVVRFLPLILFQASEIGDVLRARGIENRRNPITRLVYFCIPLFRRVFIRADALTEAMQARCYNENRTIPVLSFSKRDGMAAGLGSIICLTVFLP